MEKFPDMQGKYREFGNFPPYYIRKGAAFCIVPPLSNLPKFPKIITGEYLRNFFYFPTGFFYFFLMSLNIFFITELPLSDFV